MASLLARALCTTTLLVTIVDHAAGVAPATTAMENARGGHGPAAKAATRLAGTVIGYGGSNAGDAASAAEGAAPAPGAGARTAAADAAGMPATASSAADPLAGRPPGTAALPGSAAAAGGDIDARLRALLARHGITGEPRPKVPPPSIDDPIPQLGRRLFFSRSLSGNRDVACASCHHPLLGGGDDLSLSVGEAARIPEFLGPGRVHDATTSRDPRADGLPNVPRNAPTTFNVGFYTRALFWDGRIIAAGDDGFFTPDSVLGGTDRHAGGDLLSAQTRFPVTSPAEMRSFAFLPGEPADAVRIALVARLREGRHRDGRGQDGRSHDLWSAPFAAAFGAGPPAGAAGEARDGSATPAGAGSIDFDRIVAALAAYQNSQVFTRHGFGRYVRGDASALSPAAKRGALLFYEARDRGGLDCARCHAGDFFTDEAYHVLAMPQLGRGTGRQGTDLGRFGISHRPEDRHAFRTPSLLNVAVTGPYGHAGAYDRLDDVVRHHLDPAAAVARFDVTLATLRQFAGAPAAPYPHVRRNTEAALRDVAADTPAPLPAAAADAAVADLVAFLESLTDPCVEDAACLARWVATPADDVDGWQLPPLATGQASLATHLRFTDVTTAAGLDGIAHVPPRYGTQAGISANQQLNVVAGIAADDVDGDGFDDLFFVAGADGGGDRLLHNRGDGTFEDITRATGIESGGNGAGPVFVDTDGDGDLDLFVGGVKDVRGSEQRGHLLVPTESVATPARLYVNDGGRFTAGQPFPGTATFNTFNAAFADIDADGDLDAFLTHWDVSLAAVTDHLFLNEGGNRFRGVDATHGIGGLFSPRDFTLTPNFADVDGDGMPDLLLASDFLTSRIFRNLGDGRFADVTDPSVITDENGMGSALADFDNDGDLDWFVTSVWDTTGTRPLFQPWGVTGNRLYRNDGDFHFTDVTADAGVAEGYWGWAACAADFDLDGDVDIFHVNGFGDEREPIWHELLGAFMYNPARLFENDGSGRFRQVAEAAGIDDRRQGRGVACFDHDRDGDIDIVIANNAGPLALYRNDAAPGSWLAIRLRGATANSRGIGARIRIVAGGRAQVRQIQAGNHYVSASPAVAHFGLAGAKHVDSVEVRWPPPSSATSRLDDVAANQVLEIREP
jgi:cytochrome c peroxidase